ncbi:glycosyltransferase family 4 protein, partial [bacterium]|nr:glycosyltransferase family 4 protein [bacterium]
LFVGSIEPRKNLDTLLKALDQKPAAWPLVVSGAKGWMNAPIQDRINAAGDRVIMLGYVADEDMPLLYGAAGLFVFPSHYEGFGLPVLEAMACGTPVITTNVSSLPEVAGDACLLVNDPADADELAAAIRLLSGDEAERERRIARGFAQAARFSRSRINADLLAVYRHLLEM